MSGLTRGGTLAALSCLALPSVIGCQKPLADAECERLLDRYTEFLVREEEPSASPEQLAQTLEQARRTAVSDPRFEWSSCSRRVRRTSYECAMAAGSVDAIERCLIF